MKERHNNEPVPWFFSKNWLTVNTDLSKYSQAFNKDGRQFIIPEQTIIGKWDFAPYGYIKYYPSLRFYNKYSWFKAWGKFFADCDKHIETNSGQAPQYLVATASNRMAMFTQKLGFERIEPSDSGSIFNIVCETNKFRRRIDSIINGPEMKIYLEQALGETRNRRDMSRVKLKSAGADY